jgi:hypothetical protein
VAETVSAVPSRAEYNPAMIDEYAGYRDLARVVIRGAIEDGRRPGRAMHTVTFLQSDVGRLWLAWLRLDADTVIRALSSR